MTKRFVVESYHAYSEQDNFKKGCYGVGGLREFNYIDIKSSSFDGLKSIITDEFCGDTDSFELNACDEMGRLDLQVEQTRPFVTTKVSAKTQEKFIKGEIDLWLTTYTFIVKLVETEIDLTQY